MTAPHSDSPGYAYDFTKKTNYYPEQCYLTYNVVRRVVTYYLILRTQTKLNTVPQM